MTQGKTRASVIGLGNLGGAIAGALLAADADVAVWNRSAGRADRFAQAGATVAPTLEAALKHAEVIVFALPTYDDVQQLFSPAIDAGWLDGRAVVNLGTGDATQARATRDRFVAGGAEYLDGACGTYPSALGTESSACIYSGPRQLFDRLEGSVIRPLGADGAYVGEDIGHANSLFLATSGFFVTACAAYFEEAVHASRRGIDVDVYTDFSVTYLETIKDLMIASAPLLKARKHTGVDQAALDLYLSAAETIAADAADVGARTVLLDSTIGYLKEAVAAGYAKAEVSALYEVLEAQRATGDAGGKVLEVVVYTLRDGASHEQFVTAYDELSTWIRRQPGFVSREVMRGTADGKWIELVRWDDLESAEAVAAASVSVPECAPFFKVVDMDSALVLYGESALPAVAVPAAHRATKSGAGVERGAAREERGG